MRRYFVRAWQPDGEWQEAKNWGATTMDVLERERAPEWSGLYDASGNKLMAQDEAPPLGFLRLK